MRKEKQEKETRDCTFSPKILRKRTKSSKAYEKLYKSHKERQEEQHEKFLKTQKLRSEKEMEKCTFKPHFQSEFKEKSKP